MSVINLYIFLILILILIIIILKIINKNNILPNHNSFNPIINYYDFIEFNKLLYHENKLLKFKGTIPKYLPKRDLIPIKNKYELIKQKYDYSDFHFIVYWINSNKINVIIRRLDDIYIKYPLKLKVYDRNKYVILDFIPGKINCINENIDINIELIKIDITIKQMIPKVIIQTSKNRECSLALYNSVYTFIDLNPEYEYMHFDDIECSNYIKNNFDKIIFDVYNKLIPTAYKADLFRTCILYKLGGCYFDIKQVNRIPLRDFINPLQNIILCDDAQKYAYYNALMLTVPNNIIIKMLLDQTVENIKNNYFGTCPLCPTGPCLLYKIVEKYNNNNKINIYKPYLKNSFSFIYGYYKIRHKGNIYDKRINKIVCNTSFLGYYKMLDSAYYANLWHVNNIYKK
jgi:mannosyltransferase OCH1-like enzyme